MRFAVIGSNFISSEFVRAGRTLDGFAFTRMYSRTAARARAFAEPFGCASVATDLDALASDDGIDAVYIASPNACHFAQAKRMLEGGKHVLIEKPVCPNQAMFRALCQVADQNGLLVLEAMRSAFTPGFLALKEAVKTVGTVRRVSFSYCQYSSRYDNYKRGIVENAFDPSLCNGALMDIGVYCIYALAALFGLPARIEAVAHRLNNGLDAQGGAICVYDGMLADVSYSKIADGRRENEVQGEEGTLLIDSVTNPKRIVRIGRGGTRETLFASDDPEFFGMRHEIQAFMLLAKAPARAHAYRVATDQALQIMDEIRRQTGVDFIRKDDTEAGQ